MNDLQRKKWADKLFDMGAYAIGISVVGGLYYSEKPWKEILCISIPVILLAAFCFYMAHRFLKEME